MPNVTADEARFIWAEGQQESGGKYDDVNQNSGALGEWQVMPANLPSWLPASGQPVMTPSQFLANHQAQNAVAVHVLGGYYKQYGPEGAAAMWYSGQPDPSASFGNPPVSSYVSQVMAKMQGAPANPGIGQDGGGTPATTTAAGPGGIPGAFLNWLTGGRFGHAPSTDFSVSEIAERGALIAFGGILILVGVWVLVRGTAAGESVKSKIERVRP